jgi:tetratricopeptide (TPR) repeat protein
MIWNMLLVLALAQHPESGTHIEDVDVTAVNDHIVAFLEEHVGSIEEPTKRLNELVNLIFSKDSLNLVYDNSRTKTAIETFETRNGNCLSFTNLFIGMARHLGMNAYFQEVTNFPTWDKHGDVVVLNRHMNVVVRINNTSYTMDFNPNADRKEQHTRVVSDRRALAQYYNNLGAEQFQGGDLHGAMAYFKKSLDIDPKLGFTWSNLGVVHVNLNQLDQAEECYLKALEISGKEYTAMSNIVRLYERLDQPEKAQEFRARAQRFRNKNPYFHFSRGEVAYEEGDFPSAVKHFKTAVRRKPQVHEFYFGLAKAYSKLGMNDKAAENLKKAERYAPEVFDQDRYSQKLQTLAADLN